jgi:hypothetical protein
MLVESLPEPLPAAQIRTAREPLIIGRQKTRTFTRSGPHSDITSFDTAQWLRASLRGNAVQDVSASEG